MTQSQEHFHPWKTHQQVAWVSIHCALHRPLKSAPHSASSTTGIDFIHCCWLLHKVQGVWCWWRCRVRCLCSNIAMCVWKPCMVSVSQWPSTMTCLSAELLRGLSGQVANVDGIAESSLQFLEWALKFKYLKSVNSFLWAIDRHYPMSQGTLHKGVYVSIVACVAKTF